MTRFPTVRPGLALAAALALAALASPALANSTHRTGPYPGGGDTSGYPGANEFDPTQPYGGQAAVTARPGTDAFKEQMMNRRYFCTAYPGRC